MDKRGLNKSGQVTIFVILAIVLVVAVSAYFIFKDTLLPSGISPTFEPVEAQFLDCLGEKTSNGIMILETQGGYIELPNFIPGSRHMPFSSELTFLGVDIPYWHTISGNNIEITQVPMKKDLQNQLANYLEEEIQDCKFSSFIQEGYQISSGDSEVEVLIEDNYVRVFLEMDLNMKMGEERAVIADHKIEIDSNLGSLHDDAVGFYDLNEEEMFLENYSVDFLRLYAPVDGVELTCAPKIWNADEIFDKLKNATQDNFFAIKNSGSKDDYFNLNLPIDSDVRIINSRYWPSTYEVEPTDSPILVAEPIGNQAGLGILGFCYVPYHFVYNLRYPVLVQLTQDEEVFQFPLAILIEGNVPREPRGGRSIEDSSLDLCGDKITPINVEVSDSNLNSLDANVFYECFGSRCLIGETTGGDLDGMFPQCVNGKIVVEKEGYERLSQTFSSIESGSISVILDKKYDKRISLKLNGNNYNGKAIISFSSEEESHTVLYPEQRRINLSEGIYDVVVHVYEESNIKFEETSFEQCIDVPSGIGGIFGITHEECSQVKIPEQTISNVLVGGGSGTFSLSESDLKLNNVLEISGEKLNTPESLEELQVSYILFEAKEIGVRFI